MYPKVHHPEQPVSLMDFPPELVNEIFHYGCILSTSFCHSLCQISSWTRGLALPYLYLTVVIKKHAKNREFALALHQQSAPIFCPPTSDFSPKGCVESLWVEPVSNTVVTIFRACRNIRNIALPPDNVLWLVYTSSQVGHTVWSNNSTEVKPNLHLLLTEAHSESRLVQQTSLTLSSNFFEKITHLRIGKVASYSALADIAHYKNLTHIAIPYHLPQKQTLSYLSDVFTIPTVMVTVLVVVLLTDFLSADQYQEAIAWVKAIRINNSKIYAVTSQYCDLQAEWEGEVRRGLSIWEKAERFIQTL